MSCEVKHLIGVFEFLDSAVIFYIFSNCYTAKMVVFSSFLDSCALYLRSRVLRDRAMHSPIIASL